MEAMEDLRAESRVDSGVASLFELVLEVYIVGARGATKENKLSSSWACSAVKEPFSEAAVLEIWCC